MEDIIERWRVPIVAVLLAIIVAGLAVLYLRWPRAQASVTSADSTVRAVASPQSSLAIIRTPETKAPALKVYVTGAVAAPGVYSFRDGDRVEDALSAAGGAKAGADLSGLNLAQRLRDEAYINVPYLAGTPAQGTPAAVAPPPAASGKININNASVAQLDGLPGIGATYAQRIIDYRVKNGQYLAIRDLLDKKIVPAATFEKIKDLIDVR
jgi:competence protein ComEA